MVCIYLILFISPIPPVSEIPPVENIQNHAQNSTIEDTGDTGDIFPNSLEERKLSIQSATTSQKVLQDHSLLYSCYYCDNFETNIEADYQRHVVKTHPHKLCYPSKADLERLQIQGKGKDWEI